MESKKISSCRICNSKDLVTILDLGMQYLASYTPKSNDLTSVNTQFPLELVRCDKSVNTKNCGLVQLKHSTPPNLMYERYFYRSGINKTMQDNLAEIVNQAISKIELKNDDIVIDIGCNDGTLLNNYKKFSVRAIGFDPAKNMVQFSKESGAHIITDFFNERSFTQFYNSEKAKIITSIAMFYDLEEPDAFVHDISQILSDDGIWVLELSYLPLMLSQNAFDTIVHEHLEYYHFSVIEYLLSKNGLKVVDIILNDVNGGSFRIFVRHNHQPIKPDSYKRIMDIRNNEKKLNLDTNLQFELFKQRIYDEKSKLIDFINTEIKKGKTIYGYGASTKGNTLLQFFGLDYHLIPAIADRNPDKWGRKTIGTNIPIISEEEARIKKPDYFLILPWHFLDEFKIREKQFLNSGGHFIIPLPNFTII